MNNSKPLELQEVYTETTEPTGFYLRVNSRVVLNRKITVGNLKPQSGYLLTKDELKAFAMAIDKNASFRVYEDNYGSVPNKFPDFETLFNQLVK
jgi:hypothetical protein